MNTRIVSLGLLAAWMALLLAGTALGAESNGAPQPATEVASRIDDGRPPVTDERALRRSQEAGGAETARTPAMRGYGPGSARVAQADGAGEGTVCLPGNRSMACALCADYVARTTAAAELEFSRPGSDARSARPMALVLIEALNRTPSGDAPAMSPFTPSEAPCEIS